MEQTRGKRLPVDPNAYELFEEIGDGVSATVHRALCIPLNEIVAIKVLDLEKRNGDMDVIRREVQTMSLINHPNVVRAYCSFTSGHSLWVVMPFMAGGSCLHIMKSTYPEGFEEPVIATLLHEVLKALVYLHSQGYIHRDIKAGNILIDAKGAVKLADFGVSACLFDNWDRHRSWNTFVGTPCWMAPEVMQQLHGYDFKADVWSFGITALELAHGRAPFSKYPPMKVLLMTLQNAPPGLDYERDKRFSKSFKAMVGSCLVKDPKKRPSVEKLLKHSFFKHARSNEYLRRTILDGLVPLCERFRKLKATDAENKDRDEEHLSQQEYIKGVSAWDFNVEDLKAQAALIDDISDLSPREGMGNNKLKNILADDDDSLNALNQETCTGTNHTAADEDVLPEFQDFEGSLASFPVHPLQALKVCFDTCEDDTSTSSTEWQDAMLSSFETQQYSSETQDLEAEFHDNSERIVAKNTSPELQNCLGRPISTEDVTGHMYRNGQQTKHQPERSQNIPLISQELQEANLQVPEAREGKVIQCKGRFKVTSADIGPKGSSTSYCTSNPHSGSLTSVMPLLQFVLQQTSMQREEVTELVWLAERASGCESDIPLVCSNEDVTQSCSVSRRERELQLYAHALKQRISHLVEETQNLKMQNAQLQKQFNALSGKAADVLPRGNDEARPK